MTAVWFVAVPAALALGVLIGTTRKIVREDDKVAAGTHRLPPRVGRPDVRPYEPPSRYVGAHQNADARQVPHHSDGGRP